MAIVKKNKKKVISNNEARVPFFGDRMNFITGLDPLGLQNPSTQTYSYLLPGLNNVTTHIRSYSFYCWLLAEYAKRMTSANPDEQKRFVRRAEYIVALVAVNAKKQGISGSSYASKVLNKNPQKVDLQKGTYNADGSTPNTYWQYGFGIFGQYYVGSLRQIGLIEEPVDEMGEPMRIYRRTAANENLTVSGERLAEVFDNGVDPKNKTLFFQCISDGEIEMMDLGSLAKDFDLTTLKQGEINLLQELLLDIDEPPTRNEDSVSMRKETLSHVLRLSQRLKKQKPSEPNAGVVWDRMFTMYAYNAKGVFNQGEDDCLLGWYFYQFNEYWQVANTAIFNGLLDYLAKEKGPKWMYLGDLVKDATTTIIENLSGEYSGITTTSLVEDVLSAQTKTERKFYDQIMAEKQLDRATNGFQLIFKLFTENYSNLQKLRGYTHQRGIAVGRDGGLVFTFFRKLESNKKQLLRQFIEDFLLNNIIYRHQYVAYNKIGGGKQSTQKFIIEDNHIRKIGNFGPGFTGPRLRNLIAYLRDLGLLDAKSIITPKGEFLIK